MPNPNSFSLMTPNPIPDSRRDEWIENVSSNFVAPSAVNRSYYKLFLQMVWPEGHGIPGPHVTEAQLRTALGEFRMANNVGRNPNAPYQDVFRRFRELQGEEGVIGVVKVGKTYQLVSLTLEEKRIPRIKLSDDDWSVVLEQYDHRCAVCGRQEPEVKFDQDHKQPRTSTATRLS